MKDKVVLITGGTGSFGKAFSDLVLSLHPKKLIIFSRDEFKQSEMEKEIGRPNVRFFLGDVRDLQRLKRAFQGVDIVIHAAALKQVPALEYNPSEAIKTNIIGSENVVNAAIDCGVSKVIAISTDKAVNPINLYGATKLCMEKLFIAANAYAPHKTFFSVVRYGNVIGSRGSVIPLFLQKAKEKKPLPITDERMTRFFLTVHQGASFVSQCVEMMKGGEIFIPKVASMKITDLAEAVAPRSLWEHIGLRPGEKIHEVLLTLEESTHATETDDGFVVNGHGSMSSGFSYTSENAKRLNQADLRGLLNVK